MQDGDGAGKRDLEQRARRRGQIATGGAVEGAVTRLNEAIARAGTSGERVQNGDRSGAAHSEDRREAAIQQGPVEIAVAGLDQSRGTSRLEAGEGVQQSEQLRRESS